MTLVITRPPSTLADDLNLTPIRFGRSVCGDLTQAERRELRLANGLGAYAAGTIAGHHPADAALGQVSEIFDGTPPHTPRGRPAQAWSTACVLEAWWRLERAKSPNGRV